MPHGPTECCRWGCATASGATTAARIAPGVASGWNKAHLAWEVAELEQTLFHHLARHRYQGCTGAKPQGFAGFISWPISE